MKLIVSHIRRVPIAAREATATRPAREAGAILVAEGKLDSGAEGTVAIGFSKKQMETGVTQKELAILGLTLDQVKTLPVLPVPSKPVEVYSEVDPEAGTARLRLSAELTPAEFTARLGL